MKFVKQLLCAALLAALMLPPAHAATPVQFSFFDFSLPKDSQVIGVRVPLIYGKGGGDIRGFDLQLFAYSEMNSMKGFTLPPFFLGANRISNEMTGIAMGVFNWHQGYDTGLNFGLANITNKVDGINFSLINVGNVTRGMTLGLVNVTEEAKGLNFSLVNYASTYSMIDLGLVNVSARNNFQLSLINVADHSSFQVSLVNVTEKSNFQLSLVNVTRELKGLQLGLFNCAENTFLPCFPLFNIGF